MKVSSLGPLNGMGHVDSAKKHAILQKIKHQSSAIEKLRERKETALKHKQTLRDKPRQIFRESEKFLAILRAKIELNENELRNFLMPPFRRTSLEVDPGTCPAYVSLVSRHTQPSLARGRCLLPLKRSYAPSCSSMLFETPIQPPSNGPHQLTSAIPTLGGTHRRPSDGLTTSIMEPPETSVDKGDTFARVSIDPAVDLLLSRIQKSLRASESQVAANQNALQRFKFTQDSQNGKRIMNRIRVLESENEELARQHESGRPAQVIALVALRQHLISQIKESNEDLEQLIEESDSETEVFTSTLVMLQQQLTLARTTIEVLAASLEALEPGRCAPIFARSKWPMPESLAYLSVRATPAEINMDEKITKANPDESTAPLKSLDSVSVDISDSAASPSLPLSAVPSLISPPPEVIPASVVASPISAEVPTEHPSVSSPPPPPEKLSAPLCRDPRILRHRT